MAKKGKIETTKVEYVYSKIKDKGFGNNLDGSKVWDKCYHKEDLPADFRGFEYKVKFDGLKPIQLMGVKDYNQ